MKNSGKVYIIGAGMSGLSTALHLREMGIHTEIIEKSNRIGGLAGSFDWKGFKNLDFGPHIYHTTDEKLEMLWLKKYGDLLKEGKFWAYNVKGKNFDQFFNYPLSFESLKNISQDMRAKIINELKQVDSDKKARAKSYSAYIRELVGPTLMEMFFIKYPQKLWGISIEKMTANWAPKRVVFKKMDDHFYAGQWCAVGKYGSLGIIKKMANEFVNLDGEILLNKEIVGFEYSGQFIKKLLLKEGEGIDIHPDDIVASSMPLNMLADYLGVKNSLNYRGTKLVYIAVNKPTAINGKAHFLYYDNKEIIFHRVSEQKKFSGLGFSKNKTVLTAEIAYTIGDEVDKMGDGQIMDRVAKDFVKVGLIKNSDILDKTLVSLPYVYPVLTRESEIELVRVRSQLAIFLNLYLMGIGGDFHYADLQILYIKGYDLAKRIAGGMISNDSELVKRKSRMRFNQEIKLGNSIIGPGRNAFIIAELGLNHNGNISLALEMIDKAKEAGCSAVKLQSFDAESRVSAKIRESRYAEEVIDLEEPIYRMFKRLELRYQDHKKLFVYAHRRGIEIFSAPFDLKSVELLESLGCSFYKIASMDLVNLPLIRRVAETGKPVIISTGMSTLGQIEDALNVVGEVGNNNVMLLHCVSSYPADPADMNLNVMETLAQTFKVPVGLSDHTIGITVSTIALAMGARLIERHFTIDRFMEGPDHIFSSTPDEMAELVMLSNLIPLIQGKGEKFILESEIETINKFKKCLYARKGIKKGQKISREMLSIKGPGGGILPRYIDIVTGRMARKDIEADYPIEWNSI